MLMAALSMAQDFHMSHYDANPLYLNPALTGVRMSGEKDFRFNANYREQGGQYLGGSYKTVAAGFDTPLDKKFSIGEYVINNKGGSFNTFNLMASGSYKIVNKNSESGSYHNLSVGLQLGLLQKSFNSLNLVYDSQYSSLAPDGFDPNLPSGENISTESFFSFDANMGVYYSSVSKNNNSLFGGFSIYHLTQPNESFIGDMSKTPMRFVLHGGFRLTVSKQLSILPQFLYMDQAKANELNLGIMSFYKMQGTENEPMLGLSYRNKDAIALHLGLKQKNSIVRISYDITTSYLKQYSNGRGGLELSLILFIGKKKNLPTTIDSSKEGENLN